MSDLWHSATAEGGINNLQKYLFYTDMTSILYWRSLCKNNSTYFSTGAHSGIILL